jgi:hypothetical protein
VLELVEFAGGQVVVATVRHCPAVYSPLLECVACYSPLVEVCCYGINSIDMNERAAKMSIEASPVTCRKLSK